MASLLALKEKLGVTLAVPKKEKLEIPDEEFRVLKISAYEDDESVMSQLATVCKRALKKMNIHHLFPVQSTVVPLIINAFFAPNPNDFSVCVPTGQGKTLAYLLPIFHCLSSRTVATTRAIVLVPTRDLAKQVARVADVFARLSGLRVVCLSGQTSEIGTGNPDIVIATPGRFCDSVVSGNLVVDSVSFFVVDEADRLTAVNTDNHRWQTLMADHFAKSAHCIKLLFSATMTKNPLKLAALSLRRPLRVEQDFRAGEEANDEDKVQTSSIDHRSIKAQDERQKIVRLTKFLENEKPIKTLLFVNSVNRVKDLVNELRGSSREIIIKPFDAHLEQVDRDKTLAEFAQHDEGSYVLICSDLATRGLDISDVNVVVNFDMPSFATTYVHRAGRTGRAGKGGLVVTLVHKKEGPFFRAGLAKKLKEKHNIKIRPFVSP
jgi:superfamily II DNA/RNA helicase